MDIEYCDAMSKDVDGSDYWISSSQFRRLERLYGPFCADFFASECFIPPR